MANRVKHVQLVGSAEFSRAYARLWPQVADGVVVRVIAKGSGVHRAWIAATPLGGCDPVQVGPAELIRHLGTWFELVRDGMVLEIHGGGKRGVLAYMFWAATDEIIAAGGQAQSYDRPDRWHGAPRQVGTLAVEADRAGRGALSVA